jgi:hypothetical protein
MDEWEKVGGLIKYPKFVTFTVSPTNDKLHQIGSVISGTDVMILKIFSHEKFCEKIGVFDSKQSQTLN